MSGADSATAGAAGPDLSLTQVADHLGMSPGQAELAVRGCLHGPWPGGQPRPVLADEDLRARFDRGETSLEIAVATGFTVGTVRRRLYDLGLAPHPGCGRDRRKPAAPADQMLPALRGQDLTERQREDVAVLMAQGGYSREAAIEAVRRPKVRIRLRDAAPVREARP